MLIAEKIPRDVLEREARERYVAMHGRETAAPAPDPVNLAAAESLFEPIPLEWAGHVYQVRPISYREGLKLQRLSMAFERFQKNADATEADVDAHEQLLDGMLALFGSFLDPIPPTNPFLDATPLEVGALAGFFFTCQQIQNRPDRFAAIRLSRTTT